MIVVIVDRRRSIKNVVDLRRDKYYNRTLRNCKCKGAQYCNNTCYRAHWKEHKAEHNRLVKLVKLLPSKCETKEEPSQDKKKTTIENQSKTKIQQKPNDRCACGSKKKYKKCCGSNKR